MDEETRGALAQLEDRLSGRIAEFAEQLDEQTQLLRNIAKMPNVNGTIPVLGECEKLEVQVFYTPANAIDPKAKFAGKTNWDLRIDVWHRNHKQEQPARINLWPPAKALATAHEKDAWEDVIEFLATAVGEPAPVLAGLVRYNGVATGRKYCPSQAGVLLGHEGGTADSVVVYLAVDSEVIVLDQFRPGAGEKTGHAKWWARWDKKAWAAARAARERR